MNPAADPKPEHCPDCGAELKSGAEWCWLCNYKSPAIGAKGPADSHPREPRSNWMALTGFVVMAVGFIPACAVAFFVSCLVAIAPPGGGGPEGALPKSLDRGIAVGFGGATVVAVLIVVLMFMLFRSYHRSMLSPETRNAR